MGLPHPVSNKLEAHNCWLVCYAPLNFVKYANDGKADVVKEYIGWAIGKGYAVIDVNIPKHVTIEPVGILLLFWIDHLLTFLPKTTGKYEDEDENRPTATEELAGYLWDNYIEYVGFWPLGSRRG